MTVYEALLAALNRTPEEDRIFWQESHRREYDRSWRLEDIASTLLGIEDPEAAEMVAEARAEQTRIHNEQSRRAAILDRLYDNNESEN